MSNKYLKRILGKNVKSLQLFIFEINDFDFIKNLLGVKISVFSNFVFVMEITVNFTKYYPWNGKSKHCFTQTKLKKNNKSHIIVKQIHSSFSFRC